jgi:hypothetical protein
VVVLHAVRDALAAGHRAYVPVDACGGMSSRTEEVAFRQDRPRLSHPRAAGPGTALAERGGRPWRAGGRLVPQEQALARPA